MNWPWHELSPNPDQIVVKDAPQYAKASQNYNTLVPLYPAAIFFCRREEDVSRAVQFVNKYRTTGLSFRIRSGRHSYAELCSMNGGLIIDLSQMNEVTVLNGATPTALVGPGAPQYKIYRTVAEHEMLFPAGTAGTVCAGGVTQGGGIGMLTRRFGLTLDNLLAVRMVLASGKLATVSADTPQAQDLWWALRGGGGGNFGIITQYHFQLHPQESELLTFTLNWDAEGRAAAFAAWQEFAPSLETSRNLTSQMALYRNKAEASGLFLGSRMQLEQILKYWMAAAPGAQMSIQTHKNYLTVFEMFAEGEWKPHPFKATGAFAKVPLTSPVAVARVIGFLDQAPNDESHLWMQSFGGKMADVSPGDTAFFYRDARCILEYVGMWGEGEQPSLDVIEWVRNFRSALEAAGDTVGAYTNFHDLDLGTNAPALYYGGNLSRLQAVKRQVDRTNLFQFQLSIPPN